MDLALQEDQDHQGIHLDPENQTNIWSETWLHGLISVFNLRVMRHSKSCLLANKQAEPIIHS